MSNFNELKSAIHNQFSMMSTYDLFTTDTDRNLIWETYLNKFPEGSNLVYKERTEHDCQCCKQFIRACGNVVAIIDNKLVSIWDVLVNDEAYQTVADGLSEYVKSRPIVNTFLHYEANLGTDKNHQQTDDGILTWEHFHYKLPNEFVNKHNAGTVKSKNLSNKEVFQRSLEEITEEAIEIVLDLIDQNSIYRGDEHLSTIHLIQEHKTKYSDLSSEEEKTYYCWLTSLKLKESGKFRNTVIGTLLSDISDGVELDKGVKSFEAKVAPENYKRPTALITKGMIDKAQAKVQELGIENSLQRRFARLDDITVNNILFIDKSTKKEMGIFDELSSEVKVNISKLDKVAEVSIDEFISDVLPKAESVELMFDNTHVSNLMSLIAPANADSPNILKWDNNFSWSYNGEVTDSMKERVKTAGGSVTGVLRFSIQWNENGSDGSNDLDAHCRLPGNHIYYSRKRDSKSGGSLDVDITQPSKQTSDGIAVENITWPSLSQMPDGEYEFYVNNYSGRNTNGFRAQIEMNGEVHEFDYGKSVTSDVPVATVTLKNGAFTIDTKMDSSKSSINHYGIPTQVFHKVTMVMASPNHWDDQAIGNKHWFFILDECNNENKTRGFYNEFLKPELTEHRKVFEVLSSKMKAEHTDDQLSGLGFSSTQRNSVLCKVTGSFNRIIKINF